LEALAKWLPRQPCQTLHADIAQDVATFLQPALLGPRAYWALQLPIVH
jgi:hypothetical protein